jgi:hypothetical protein
LLTAARLDAGFLICTDDELRSLHGLALPDSGVEIENAPGFQSEVRVAGKNPTPVLPRTKGIGT